MKLTSLQSYLSIEMFETVELPPLTIIIGPNGSGKSHFLQAINNRSISVDVAPYRNDNSSVKMIESGRYAELGHSASSKFFREKDHYREQPRHLEVINHFEIERAQQLAGNAVELCEIFPERFSKENVKEIRWQDGPDALSDRIGLSADDDRRGDIRRIFREANIALTRVDAVEFGADFFTPRDNVFRMISIVSKNKRIEPTKVTLQDILDAGSWGTISPYEPNIASIFSYYRDARTSNDLKQITDLRTGTSSALSEDQFLSEFGAPPWEVATDIVQQFCLPYEVVSPPEDIELPCTFQLRKLNGGVDVPYGALSSGEKVIMQLALSLMQFDSLRFTVPEVNLLLLDEMDSSLHPELVGVWLDTIRNIVVAERGINVILSTHSPITVALAPEESLFEMSSGISTPRRITKQQAINRLTVGIPALAIDYSGRRQVFVESESDAIIYETISSLLKSRFQFPRSLTFISTGMRTIGGDVNNGSSIVKKTVGRLEQSGNISTFGIIDWDGVNTSTDRVKVMAEGTHYSLENLLLNPLALYALLTKIQKLKDCSVTFVGLEKASKEELQMCVDIIQDAIFVDKNHKEYIEFEFASSNKLNVRKEFCLMNGHELERKVISKYPQLQRYTGQRPGNLMLEVVNQVFREHLGFCPKAIVDTLSSIASQQ